MSARKPVDKVHRYLSADEIARRREEANPKHVLGTPPRQQGYPFAVRRAWNLFVEELSARRVLYRDDGPLLLALIEARRAKDKARIAEIKAIFDSREPAPIEPPEAKPAPESNPPADPPPKPQTSAADVAKTYANDVLSGAILACKYVKQA